MEWFRDNAWEAWLGLAILLGIAELFSLDLILIMLAGGAVLGMLAAMLGLPVELQVLIAAGAAVAMVGLVRPTAVKRMRDFPTHEQGHTKLVGEHALVTEMISTHQVGRIKLGGEIWTAKAYDETVSIRPGETVEVLQIKGATAVVLPIPSLES